MEINISFQLVALIMLLITLIFFSYKNWISVAKNRIYLTMIVMELTALAVNLALCTGYVLTGESIRHLEIISQVFTSIVFLLLYFQLLRYNLAMTGKILLSEKFGFKLLKLLVAVCVLTSLVPMILGVSGFPHEKMEEFAMRGRMVQSVAVVICLLMAAAVVWFSRKNLSRREFTVLFGSDILMLGDVAAERIVSTDNLASYYVAAFVLVVYYMLLHNIDRYRFLSSGCFSRAGFRMVLREKELYRENFRCLGICINNIESITNCCSESEIVEIHGLIGSLLKKCCGRHHVYHIHSFEYVVMLRDNADVEKKHRELANTLPSYIRINNKNVSLFCDFYSVEFRDADFQTGNFLGLLTSMRKIAMTHMDRTQLLCYSDESKYDIKKDMEAMRIVNTCISRKNFSLQIYPIQSKNDRDKFSYEFTICAKYEDGEVISQELIWDLASQMGYQHDIGEIVFELVCKYIMLNKLQDSEAERIHINLESAQISSEELAKKYVDCLDRYSIPGDFICIEVTMNQTEDYDSMERAFVLLRQRGVKILLDQFGVTVCNLKTVLNMSFHGVKINHHMVKLFCDGVSEQLVYMLDMLNNSHWSIVLDGIDREEYLSMLDKLQFHYIQGMLLQKDYDSENEHTLSRGIGGAVYG